MRAAGTRVGVGAVDRYDGREVDIPMYVSDPVNWTEQVRPALQELTGDYPRNADEVMLSDSALTALGIDRPLVGMPVELEFHYRGDGREETPAPQTRTFRLSGFYADQTTRALAYLSEAGRVESGVPTTDKIAATLYLTLDWPYLDAAGVADLADRLGVDDRTQVFHADDTGLRSLWVAAAAITGLVLLIGASAALVVHSLLTIWLGRQARLSGLLSTLGATGVQLRRLVRRQVVRAGITGIVLGAVAGAAVSVLLVPRLLSGLELPATVSPLVPVAACGIAVPVVAATLALSSRGPLRRVAALSPVEAARYRPLAFRSAARLRRGPVALRLAGRALARDRRRTLGIAGSFVLALTTGLVAAVLVASNDSARVLEQLMPHDLVLTAQEQSTMDRDTVAQIAALDGVRATRVITADPLTLPQQDAIGEDYYDEFFDRMTYQPFAEVREHFLAHPEDFHGSLVGIDDQEFAELNASLDTPVDPADFRAGRAVVLSTWHTLTDWDADRVVGQDLTAITPDGTSHALPVAAVTTAGPILPTGVSPDVIVSEQVAAELLGEPTVTEIDVDYDRSYDRATEEAVLAVAGPAQVDSMIVSLDEMGTGAQQIAVLGLAVALVLLAVALVNFTTAIWATVHARSREYALLEAVGATGRQQRVAAVLEGFGYWLAAAPLSVLLALPLAAVAFRATDDFGIDATVPWWPGLVALAAFAAVCALVPVLALRTVRRGAVVDRLR